MPFPDSFLLLQQEGYLIRTSLAQGLTLLRSADLGEKGHYYGAFFGLSIGLERLLKVIIILDHMAGHDLVPPGRAALRKYGHDVVNLLSSAQSIASVTPGQRLNAIVPGTIEFEIVRHLGEFAESCGRYANLDALASGRSQSEPLADWKKLIMRILEEDVPARAKERASQEAAALVDAFAGSAKVIAHDLDREPLSLQQWFESPRMAELAASRAVVRVLRVLCPLKELLGQVCTRVHQETQRRGLREPVVPFLGEFLDFVVDDERNSLKKKRWP
jgi:hypothetical protein